MSLEHKMPKLGEVSVPIEHGYFHMGLCKTRTASARAGKKQISEYIEELVLAHLRMRGSLAEPNSKASVADEWDY